MLSSRPLISRSSLRILHIPRIAQRDNTRASFSTFTVRLQQNKTMAERPTGLKAISGIELLTFPTPNGVKASILLEELKEAYGKEYTMQAIDIRTNVQKEPWFTKLGPNGRIPVIVDHDQGGFAVQEGLAILSYLTRHYDPDHKFSFTDPFDISRAEQWMAWQHGGLGPMQGQANHFNRFAPERIPYGMQRYTGETERLVGILDNHLKDQDYLVGNKYSIADIASFGWVNGLRFAGVDIDRFPNLKAWAERILARPAVAKGLAVPFDMGLGNDQYLKKLEDDREFAEKEKALAEQIQAAKEKYGYKYASP
ncbi:glutathione S-transferase II [Periconia macrospinosa]|uniref:Glutathione S-transferase II n=1 Tax=Periconia macrospinosa TaxID=97972 RepID=A0A2V1DHI9_9PLEO|nr:glutathione S-transferase II [Periconia macrospinosa]